MREQDGRGRDFQSGRRAGQLQYNQQGGEHDETPGSSSLFLHFQLFLTDPNPMLFTAIPFLHRCNQSGQLAFLDHGSHGTTGSPIAAEANRSQGVLQ